MLHRDVRRRQRDVAPHHLERRMAEDLLQTENVAAVDEVASRERVAAEMRVQPRHAGTGGDALDRRGEAALPERSAV